MTRGLVLITILLLAGCAENYTVFHSQTGNPIILGRRAYSHEGCLSTMREEAARLGVSLSAVQVRGSLARPITLVAPLSQGMRAKGPSVPERLPHGIYPNVPPLSPQG